jgi:hypothetical protein
LYISSGLRMAIPSAAASAEASQLWGWGQEGDITYTFTLGALLEADLSLPSPNRTRLMSVRSGFLAALQDYARSFDAPWAPRTGRQICFPVRALSKAARSHRRKHAAIGAMGTISTWRAPRAERGPKPGELTTTRLAWWYKSLSHSDDQHRILQHSLQWQKPATSLELQIGRGGA